MTRYQRRTASISTMTAQTIMTAVRTMLTVPETADAGIDSRGQKLSVMLSHPAVSVVAATNSIGSRVTSA